MKTNEVETLAYMRDMSEQLSVMAKQNQFHTLAFLFETATENAHRKLSDTSMFDGRQRTGTE